MSIPADRRSFKTWKRAGREAEWNGWRISAHPYRTICAPVQFALAVESPAVSSFRWLSVCTRGALVAAGRFSSAEFPGFLPETPPRRFPRFDLVNRHAVDARVRPDWRAPASMPLPVCVPPIDPVVQHIEPELRFLLRLLSAASVSAKRVSPPSRRYSRLRVAGLP